MLRAHAGEMLRRRPVLLGGVRHRDADDEQDRHRGEDRPALPAAADHPPEGRVSAAGISSIASNSTKFERPDGFSNGIAELTLKNPPPLVPSSLMISCEATGPNASVCEPPASVCAVADPAKVWIVPCETSSRAADDRDRQQHVEQRPHEVLPEVAEAAAAARGDAADQRDGDADADGGGDEVLHRQPRHLAEVRHRRLAAVVLPVRVGDERRRGVEGHVPGARVKAFGVEGMQRLGAQDQVQREPEEAREDQQAAGVGLPVLPLVRITRRTRWNSRSSGPTTGERKTGSPV